MEEVKLMEEIKDSILDTVKKYIGLTPEYEQFDSTIIMMINTVFMALHQMGIGPSNMFTITDRSSTWSEFTDNESQLEPVKVYVSMRTRMMFDPPTVSAVTESVNNTIKEAEWRMFTHTELKELSESKS